jgi:hypothetical protein
MIPIQFGLFETAYTESEEQHDLAAGQCGDHKLEPSPPGRRGLK